MERQTFQPATKGAESAEHLVSASKNAETLNAFFNKWHSLTELSRLSVIKSLKKEGSISFVGKPKEDSFHCPLYRFPLHVPCTVANCPYQVNHATSKNCSIYALEVTKQPRFTPQEISQLLGVGLSAVNASLENSVRLVQLSLVQDRLAHVIIPKFSFLPGHCVSCGINISEELGMDSGLTLDANHGWCSTECKHKSPQWVFNIEKTFACDFKYVLAAAYCVQKKPDLVDQMLGAPQGTCSELLPELKKIVSEFF